MPATGKVPHQGRAQWLGVGTLVERTSRLVLLARMDGTDAREYPRGLHEDTPARARATAKTLTYDRGKEMAEPRAWPSGSRCGSSCDRTARGTRPMNT